MSNLVDKVRVVARSERWLVLDKPSGLLSVPGRGEANRVCAAEWVRREVPGASGPITVHRLDMSTSGLLLVALDAEAHRTLSGQFERRTVAKRYVAVVAGRVAGDSGLIDVPMRCDITRRPLQIVDWVQGRGAQTRWRVLERGDDRTRLELVPLTGRSHQLRVHCAYAGPGGLAGENPPAGAQGHPIMGDELYGDGQSAERLLLHAEMLAFDDPASGERVTVVSLPEF